MAALVTCPTCKTRTAGIRGLCHHCGEPLPEELEDNAERQTQVQEVVEAEEIICPHCGTSTSASFNLCHRCGKKIPKNLKQGVVRCTNCFERTPRAHDTCEHCGAPIPDYLRAEGREELHKEAEEARAEAAMAPPPPPQQTTLHVVEQEPEPHEEEEPADKPEPEPAFVPRSLARIEPEPETPVVPAKRPLARPSDTTMKLLIRRNQKSGIVRRHIAFTIDVRAELSPEMLALVKKYKMGGEILFYKEKVDLSDYWLLGPFRQFVRVLAARFWNIRITVNDLVKGKHMECKDIREMLEAEEQIREASATFKHILQSAAHFGGEEVINL